MAASAAAADAEELRPKEIYSLFEEEINRLKNRLEHLNAQKAKAIDDGATGKAERYDRKIARCAIRLKEARITARAAAFGHFDEKFRPTISLHSLKVDEALYSLKRALFYCSRLEGVESMRINTGP